MRLKKLLTISAAVLFLHVEAWCQNTILISKKDFTLSIINDSHDTLFSCPIAAGKNLGQKEAEGDMKTPEGRFAIVEVCNSSCWEHDFHDGNGSVPDAYGPYFIRLNVPGFTGIGIHGTCFPESIGTRATEGCIRLRNEDLLSLRELIGLQDVVDIQPDFPPEEKEILAN